MFWIILAIIAVIVLYIALGIFVDVMFLDNILEDDGLIFVWPIITILLGAMAFFEWLRYKFKDLHRLLERERSNKYDT